MAPHLVLQIEVEVEVEAAAVEVASRRGSRALPRYVLDNEPTVSAGSFFSRENMVYQVLHVIFQKSFTWRVPTISPRLVE